MFHLKHQVLIAIERHMIIEAFLIVAVASFDLSIMSGCTGTDSFMTDM